MDPAVPRVQLTGFYFLRFSTGRCHLIFLLCMVAPVVAYLPLLLCLV